MLPGLVISFHPHTFYVVRHGQTDWNVQRRLLGHREIELNRVGRAHARDAGRCLTFLLPQDRPLTYLTGPMHRTREAMRLMRGAMRLPPDGFAIDDRLKEIDFGLWEGRRWHEIRDDEPSAFANRERDPWTFQMPGGESHATLARRVLAALRAVTSDAVVVAHGGVVRVMLALFGGVDPLVAPTLEVPQGRVLVLRAGRFAWVDASTDLALRNA